MPPPDIPYAPSTSVLHQGRRQEALPRILGFILSDTANAINCFRLLFEEQQSRPLENYPGPDSTVEIMLSSFVFWADSLHYLFLEAAHLFEKRHRETLVEANGLLDLYQDIIMWPGFFSEHQKLIDDIFDGFAFVTYLVPNRSLGHRIEPRASALWFHVWENRHNFAIWNDGADNSPTHSGASRSSSVVTLLRVYQGYYESTNKMAAPVSTYIHHVTLHIWATCDGRLEDFLGLETVMNHPILMKNLDNHILADGIDTLLREVFVDTIGLDVLFARFRAVLCGVRSSLNAELFTGCVSLLGILSEGREVDIMPYLVQHQIMNLVIGIVGDSRLEDGTAPTTMYHNTWILFDITTRYYQRSGVVVTRGEDVVAFLSASLDAIVAKRNKMFVLPDVFESDLLDSMQAHYNNAKHSQNTLHSTRSSVALVKGMKEGARMHWWPSLVRLRKAKHRNANDRARLQSLIDIWKGFGAILGLEAKEERRRHEEEARTGCSWRNCPLRGHFAPEERPTLRKCAGCGETRYCSRECQSKDWKHGGHKARCKRLKK